MDCYSTISQRSHMHVFACTYIHSSSMSVICNCMWSTAVGDSLTMLHAVYNACSALFLFPWSCQVCLCRCKRSTCPWKSKSSFFYPNTPACREQQAKQLPSPAVVHHYNLGLLCAMHGGNYTLRFCNCILYVIGTCCSVLLQLVMSCSCYTVTCLFLYLPFIVSLPTVFFINQTTGGCGSGESIKSAMLHLHDSV